MGKDITSLPEVWIVTGFSYDCDGTRILAVCPTEQDAQNAVNYYKKHYNDVKYECFSQETYDPVPVFYGGVFSAEVRPYKDDTYILGQVRITQSENPLDREVDPRSSRTSHSLLPTRLMILVMSPMSCAETTSQQWKSRLRPISTLVRRQENG